MAGQDNLHIGQTQDLIEEHHPAAVACPLDSMGEALVGYVGELRYGYGGNL